MIETGPVALSVTIQPAPPVRAVVPPTAISITAIMWRRHRRCQPVSGNGGRTDGIRSGDALGYATAFAAIGEGHGIHMATTKAENVLRELAVVAGIG